MHRGDGILPTARGRLNGPSLVPSQAGNMLRHIFVFLFTDLSGKTTPRVSVLSTVMYSMEDNNMQCIRAMSTTIPSSSGAPLRTARPTTVVRMELQLRQGRHVILFARAARHLWSIIYVYQRVPESAPLRILYTSTSGLRLKNIQQTTSDGDRQLHPPNLTGLRFANRPHGPISRSCELLILYKA